MDFYSLSALATIIFCERGLPFLYQGQEIGMSNRQWKYDEFNDLETNQSVSDRIEGRNVQRTGIGDRKTSQQR